MSHLVLLCLQIEAVVLLRIDLDRHALMDLKSEAGKSVDLLRIVRARYSACFFEIAIRLLRSMISFKRRIACSLSGENG